MESKDKEETISDEARKAWEVGKKLGLLSKVSSWFAKGILVVNEFLREDRKQANLFELPLICRFYTWYRKDGSCKSKLDRMLVNDEWLNRWPNYSMKNCGRTFSDHCPIFIESSVKEWGPKPFKFINIWISYPNFKAFIKRRWEDHKVLRWAGFQLKEKLKLLKYDLKSWNKPVFSNIDNQIEERK
ncbi:hypothetical protein ACS0TY_000790 [Phlomoides rotata]